MKDLNIHYLLKVIIIASVLLFPLVMVMNTLISGNIDFGYDHARDFLSGLSNLHKFSLIGSTTGIPGVFYGPYWIWLISFGLLFSLDPRIVVFSILTIPYFTIFPYILLKFRKIFGLTTCIFLWLLFMLSTGVKYATSPWNPHPAPLLFLLIIYQATSLDFSKKGNKKYLSIFMIGLTQGFILSFHLSLGIGIAAGIIIFFIFKLLADLVYNKDKKKKLLTSTFLRFAVFGTGIFVTFIPFLIFEIRHGFNQIQTALRVISSSSAVVGVIGLNDGLILQSFFGKMGDLLSLPMLPASVSLFVVVIYYIYLFKKKKIKFSQNEINLLIFLISLSLGILSVYLSSKNPVWSYHFIGVEIIFLFLIGLIVEKIKILKIILGVWIVLFILLNLRATIDSFHQSQYINSSSLATEEYVTRSIIKDAGKNKFNVFAYSPAIYTYEYSYLFKWIGHRDISYDPGANHTNSSLVYLIIPTTSDIIKQDFINYRTPPARFLTVKQWHLRDGTAIIKRQIKE